MIKRRIRFKKPTLEFSGWNILILLVVVILPYIGMWGYKKWCDHKFEALQKGGVIVIDKENMQLRVVGSDGNEEMNFGMSCGVNYGDKRQKGDMRTPEGFFRVSQIQESSSWKHDFNDGNGEISGAYGPFFFRLDTPGHKGIGIHGTHNPNSIGTRATEGCIRLNNENVLRLRERIYVGMPVVILPSIEDMRQTVVDDENED